MGRPLFSSTRQPAVRVEPEPQHPTYEKWTYWNAFDPDSDEFFENDDAVYEAFIDPADRIQLSADSTEPLPVADVDVSSSSEASSSGRGTPMQVVDTDAEREQQQALSAIRGFTDAMPPLPVFVEVGRSTSQDGPYGMLGDRVETTRTLERDARELRPAVRERMPTYLDLPQEDESPSSPAPEPVARYTTSIPSVFTPSFMPSTPVRPVTPPSQMTSAFVSPSPPPSTTPRIYSWASIPPALPNPGSPLTNRGARRSVPHITAQNLIAAHRAA